MINDMFGGGTMGPNITPKTTPGGGDAKPPYLQMRKPLAFPGMGGMGRFQPPQMPQQPNAPTRAPGGAAWGPGGPQQLPKTQPVVTPKSSVVPGEVKSPTTPGGNLNDVYNFFKSDLENQKNQALAGSRSDAAARGVFYGTPLTGSEADINTQYLRGLGQLQAGMYGNEQQNQLSRLGIATQLYGMGAQGQPSAPGPLDLSGLASLFGQTPNLTGQRTGPAITPMQKTGDKITPKVETN